MPSSYTYPAMVEQDEDGRFVVSFRDLPGATDGATLEEALTEAEDCLAEALASCIDDAWRPCPIPTPSKLRRGEYMVDVDPLIAAKLAIHQAMRDADMTGADLARELGWHETTVRRLLSPSHKSRLEQLVLILRTLGRKVRLSVVQAA